MLVCVAELLQASDFLDIEARYPNMGLYFGDLLPQAIAEQRDKLGLFMGAICENNVAHQACIDALLFVLHRAHSRGPTRFSELADRVFGNGICPIGLYRDQNNIFNQGSLADLLSWRPNPWMIPKDEDLSRMESLLCKQSDPRPPRSADSELCHRSFDNIKCYFSAAAVAIDYCT